MSDMEAGDDVASNGRAPGSLTGVLRLAAGAWWHTTEWSVGISVRATRRALEVALAPEKAGELVRDVQGAASAAARGLLGLADLETRVRNATEANEMARKVSDAMPSTEAAMKVVEAVPGGEVARRLAGTVVPSSSKAQGRGGSQNGNLPLREMGQELMRRSRDVHYEEDAHPAYERLVESLAPDEARILRLLLLNGPQPAVDVRTGGPIGLINSRLLAPGLNMIGARAGARYVERVPSYLTNLHRLGLIWFSRETIRDPECYQVLEAQPDVLAAIHSVRQAKIVRRSIHLTPFGEGFCRALLLDDDRQLRDLPVHASPEKRRDPQPPELMD
jgi:hypothetical protein